MRALTTEALLQQLPMLQRLMARLVDCKPTGAACQDHVVQVNLSRILGSQQPAETAFSESPDTAHAPRHFYRSYAVADMLTIAGLQDSH